MTVKMRKIISLLLLALLLAACGAPGPIPGAENTDARVRAAVAHYGGDAWRDTLSHLTQSLAMNLLAGETELRTAGLDFSELDAVFLDKSAADYPDLPELQEALRSFAEAGGAVFLDNAFAAVFDRGFLGISETVKMDSAPENIEYPGVSADYAPLQGLVRDFEGLYRGFADYYGGFALRDHGLAFKTAGATALALSGGYALYAINRVGGGLVMLTSPLLPNSFAIGGFDMEPREGQEYFINTLASANQLFVNEFVNLVSKEKFGFAVERVFGSYGRPAIAWELHYEEITGIKNNALVEFSELLKEYRQIPSFTLVRNPYWWYLRAESVTYLPSGGGYSFEPDAYENAYSSGIHAVADGRWLSGKWVQDTVSYFDDNGGYPERAAPTVRDMNWDGTPDLLLGGADGALLLYEGVPNRERFTLTNPRTLKTTDGADLFAGSFSAPLLWDADGDGVLDIVSGSGDGHVLWWRGTADGYEPRGDLVPPDAGGAAVMPDAGDIDGDGKADLVVGTSGGALRVYYGEHTPEGPAFSRPVSVPAEDCGGFLAPRLVDYDGDGLPDLAVGTFDGYIAKFRNIGGAFERDGWFTGSETNYKGNERLKFGNNAMPFFADLNGDGQPDLIVGSLEYGLAYPFDSDYFPYRAELLKQVEYCRERGIYFALHFMTHEYASKEHERLELEMHIAAMESLGVDVPGTGTNHHTWKSSSLSPTQTYLTQYEAGLLWNSGAQPPGNPQQLNAETVLSLPFYLTRGGEKTMFMLNTPTLLYDNGEWSALSAKYGVPMCVYFHCDNIYKDAGAKRASIQVVADFAERHNYSFVMENQLVLASAAACNTALEVRGSFNGRSAVTLRAAPADRGLALYDSRYSGAVGAKITLAARHSGSSIATDADVWYEEGGALYVGLGKPVTLSLRRGSGGDGAHLERVNLPADIAVREDGATVRFLDGGMMEAEVAGRAATSSEGWIVTEAEGSTIFTKYGKDPETLILSFE